MIIEISLKYKSLAYFYDNKFVKCLINKTTMLITLDLMEVQS